MDFRDARLNELIYQINDAPKVRNLGDSQMGISHTGSLLSPLFIFYQPENGDLPESTRQMLERLIGVLPFKDETPCLVQADGHSLQEFHAFIQQHAPRWVFLHHIHGTTENNAVLDIGESSCIAGLSLEQLDRNPAERKAFWNVVQDLMKLKK